MGDILYTYKKSKVYANITNHCNCNCRFCIRSHRDNVGDANNLWHEKEPTFEDIKAAIDDFDFTGFEEFVFCGFGEPTCALDMLLKVGEYVKRKHSNIKIRIDTNGLGNLYHKRNIVPELAKVVDRVSISLNAPTAEAYQDITRPRYDNAFEAMLDFAKQCRDRFEFTRFTVVDVLSPEDIELSQKIADDCGINLTVRKYS